MSAARTWKERFVCYLRRDQFSGLRQHVASRLPPPPNGSPSLIRPAVCLSSLRRNSKARLHAIISDANPTESSEPPVYEALSTETYPPPQARRSSVPTFLPLSFRPLIPASPPRRVAMSDNRIPRRVPICENPDCRAVFSPERVPQACRGCHAAAYCGRQCQMAAWKLHKSV